MQGVGERVLILPADDGSASFPRRKVALMSLKDMIFEGPTAPRVVLDQVELATLVESSHAWTGVSGLAILGTGTDNCGSEVDVVKGVCGMNCAVVSKVSC